MKIAIDNGPLNSGHSIRGVGAYTRELIKALGSEVTAVDFRNTDLSGYDVIHYPYFNPFVVTLPLVKPTKTIVTIHDLIPLLYPAHYPPGIKGSVNYFINKIIIKNADAIITDTETSKKDIVRLLGINPEKIHVVYLAPRSIFKKIKNAKLLSETTKKYKLPAKFMLYVGDINYNKNIPNLIRSAKDVQMPLVMVGKQAVEIDGITKDMKSIRGPQDFLRFLIGKPHPELAHYEEILKELKSNPNVYRLGYLSDEDLVAIYNLATIYVQPSLYEGFGLPALEAEVSGTVVAASQTQSLVEILGKDGNYFDPNDVHEMADIIKKAKKNGKLPRVYSWEKTAQETRLVYKSI